MTPDPTPGYHGRLQMGGEVYRFTPDGHDTGRPIKDALKLGEQLSVPTLFGRAKAKVTEMRDDRATAMSGDLICWLRFGADDRACWTCTTTGDAKALVKGLLF